MPVEFIGMIATKDQSETKLSRGPVIDKEFTRRFVRAHEDAGFDRVLIGYASSQPDGTQVAAYAAAHSERLGFERALAENSAIENVCDAGSGIFVDCLAFNGRGANDGVEK